MFRNVNIQLCQILFRFADRGWYTVVLIFSCAGYGFTLLIAVDIPRCSARPCRSEVLSISIVIAVDIRLRQVCFRFADRG